MSQLSWSSTLKLPNSKFLVRPYPGLFKTHIQRSSDALYAWQDIQRKDAPVFIVHDGPPYANGTLHVGHALNKILKDMIMRVELQKGHRVQYIPGWDCHGLPIELKALAEAAENPSIIPPSVVPKSSSTSASASTSVSDLTPLAVRRIARNLANRAIHEQMAQFRSMGIMGDWGHRYLTMQPAYEIRQLRLFKQLVHRGLIYRRYKPVYWSPSSRTALAEAELEYNDKHKSTSAFVRFTILNDSLPPALRTLLPSSSALSAVIWTTTPWTLPANEAIAVHRDLDYAIVRLNRPSSAPEHLIVAESCLEAFTQICCAATGDTPALPPPAIVARGIAGADLLSLRYVNPLRGRNAPSQPVIHADFVTADSGSGLVHVAPGHGFEDYEVGMRHGLGASAPVDDAGKFTADAYPDDPSQLEGMFVQSKGNTAVLQLLGDAVLAVHRYQHKYPYDWRSKKPIIMRATAQWFADVAEIKDEAVASLKTVRFMPAGGRSRLESFVKGRSEWCISRQRAWGVPIPALHGDDGSVVLTEESVEHILGVLEKRGTDAWWSDAADDAAWMPPSLQASHPGVVFRRGTDTMDVWFDSGSSWTQLANKAQADVYLEGSDQHRGWFQSSLLTRVAALGHPDEGKGKPSKVDVSTLSPFKMLVTHGFLLDGKGKKMSKSLGNIITPEEVMSGQLLPMIRRHKWPWHIRQNIPEERHDDVEEQSTVRDYEALGPDALRMWVASSDYTSDVVVSGKVLRSVHTNLMRYRKSLRLMTGAMFESARGQPLTALDQFAWIQLQDAMTDVWAAFERLEFYRAMSIINYWIVNHFSAFYIEAAKDRLYCGDGGSIMDALFLGLMRMLAPLLPQLVEEAWDAAPSWLRESTTHPLKELYHAPILDTSRLIYDDARMRQTLPVIQAAKSAIRLAAEKARNDKRMGSSLQCSVILEVPSHAGTPSGPNPLELLQDHADCLEEIMVVSTLSLNKPVPKEDAVDWQYSAPFTIYGVKCKAWVLPPVQHKCPRCWRHVAEVEDFLCGRCSDIMDDTEWPTKLVPGAIPHVDYDDRIPVETEVKKEMGEEVLEEKKKKNDDEDEP